jgi:CheY-like chemotaxis protein/HPt (histidine-containing phosphotransfer) domain-containing protein
VVLHFSVTDTGIGIPADKLEAVFAPFEQADGTRTRRHGGTGLGLTLSARLVRLMGGRLWAESEPGRGSTFHFAVPFAPRRGDAPAPAPAAQLSDLAVLVVDDNATNLRILQETLQGWKMRPTAAAGGREALERLEQAARAGEPFPVVLSDTHMPEMDGFMLAEEIRAHPELAGTLILMLTSGGQAEDRALCRRLGIPYYLTKPVKQAELWKAITLALRGADRGEVREPPAAPPPPPPGRGLRVLLAEDNPVNQKLVVTLLERQGHAVVVADNGRRALEALGMAGGGGAPAAPAGFDVVLMDVQMPELDGLEAAAAIRRFEQAHGGHVPVVAMTAFALKGDRELCLRAGMDAYISKPVKIREVLDTIARLVPAAAPPAAGNGQAAGEPPAGEPAALVDWGAALEFVNGDRQLLRVLVQMFLAECPQWLANARRAAAAGDGAELKRAAHTVKGTLGHFGAWPGFEAARRLETLARDGILEGAEEALAALERELQRCTPLLAEFVHDPSSLAL